MFKEKWLVITTHSKTGNICRSPTAEAVFTHIVKEKGLADDWTIDSCGTADYHIGGPPDERAVACLGKHSIPVNHACRQLTREDFSNFQYIFGMDDSNIRNINAVKPKDSTAKVMLLGSYDPKGHKIIQDPYYGGAAGFDIVYEQVTRCSENFLKEVYGEK
ncbi:low molecular weight phosphotyrosine protein phosphatase-like isoform X3 [Glandiceps talaboti]